MAQKTKTYNVSYNIYLRSGMPHFVKKVKIVFSSLHTPSDREMENHINFSDSAPKIKDLALTVHCAKKELE
jgi:hypothetical protein